ncbi:ABC transporter permease [Paenibacillus pasadenensis]|uniref:ABC transporter permease n=1 Tax=Paenibacillus pasadenensis TaxID=217090 RepID=UPI002041F2FB|nr:ABC transporter permease [Paenibacillus pasadenensis]MCM3749035.1 ABC transporter permease [Paenibacillus pasadenensis]
MMDLLPLVQNETLKIWKKKRFYVILLILLVLIPLFTYAQMRVSMTNAENFKDWRNQVQQEITEKQNLLANDRMPEEWKKYDRIQVQQLQYYLDNDVNPNSPDAAGFTRMFMASSVAMFFPLLILALSSDLVSGERTGGTIKMLLTRPVRRWKILMSKLIALTMYVSLAIITTGAVCYLISGLVFGYGGWTMPVFTGFVVNGAAIDTSGVHPVPQWKYIIMQSGLIWISCMTIAILSLMVSVLVRSTAASIVTMMAAVISGSILAGMTSSWQAAKYLFSVNIDLTDYLEGTPPPIAGMDILFSLSVLGIWSLAALIVSFAVFTKQDILN